MATYTIALVLFLALTACAVFFNRLPLRFRDRPCQGKGWRSAFPDVPKEEIRKFLGLFAAAFAFPDKQKLKFSPEDRVLEIYRAIYPEKWMPDGLELEILTSSVEKIYGVSLVSVWRDELTLGELFGKTLAV